MKSFLQEVSLGLSKKKKKLSSKWFYDFHGSKLFEQITKLEEYYPTRTERKILKDNKHKKITFFYPSTTNIEVNKNSAYSKIKLIAEKKIKKICSQFKIKHSIYRFPAIYSRQSVSLINVNPPNLIKHINANKKITKILF